MAFVLLFRTNLLLCLCAIIQSRQIFDLSYKLGSNTKHPDMFNFTNIQGSVHPRYETRLFCAEEAASTHLVAPMSIVHNKWSVEAIPPYRLIVPLVVIRFKENKNIGKYDIERWENTHSIIEPGSVVILDSGWVSPWDDIYSQLPPTQQAIGFDREACEFLIAKYVYGIGVDSPYIDGEQYKQGQMPCRHVLADANIYVLQNVRVVSELPDTGTTIFVAPLKMQSALASPSRIIAVIEEE